MDCVGEGGAAGDEVAERTLEMHAGTSAELAVALARGEEPDASLATDEVDNGAGKVKSALLDTIAVEQDNIQETVVKDGFLDASEICSGRYAAACKEHGVQ
jgi:D-xylose transport system substrate-binding protein